MAEEEKTKRVDEQDPLWDRLASMTFEKAKTNVPKADLSVFSIIALLNAQDLRNE
jgi:hypothetical protein